jgi:hypothetical protein
MSKIEEVRERDGLRKLAAQFQQVAQAFGEEDIISVRVDDLTLVATLWRDEQMAAQRSEVERLTAALAEMTRCRDNAVRAYEQACSQVGPGDVDGLIAGVLAGHGMDVPDIDLAVPALVAVLAAHVAELEQRPRYRPGDFAIEVGKQFPLTLKILEVSADGYLVEEQTCQYDQVRWGLVEFETATEPFPTGEGVPHEADDAAQPEMVSVRKGDLVTHLNSEGDETQVEIEALNRLLKAAGIDQ